MRHYLLTRSAYGPAWDLAANRRRLALTRGITVRSIEAQTTHDFVWYVLLDPRDELLEERKAAYPGAWFLYAALDGGASDAAFAGYKVNWAQMVGSREDKIAMTRLDDDDALAPWAMARIRTAAEKANQRTALLLPHGIRVWQGSFTVVRHASNAMQTLVTPPGDAMTVYDYPHRKVRHWAAVQNIDNRIGWLWSRHDDSISGWRFSDLPLTDYFRAMFPVDWDLLGRATGRTRLVKSPVCAGRTFR